MNKNVEEIRERCKTNTDKEARKEICVTRIEDVDDVEHEGSRRKKEALGERKTTRKHDPRQPSEQERIEHEVTRLPFRSWCRHCVKGWERDEVCRTATEEEKQVPEIHLDHMFMGDEKKGKTLALLVARCSAGWFRRSRREWICRRLMA